MGLFNLKDRLIRGLPQDEQNRIEAMKASTLSKSPLMGNPLNRGKHGTGPIIAPFVDSETTGGAPMPQDVINSAPKFDTPSATSPQVGTNTDTDTGGDTHWYDKNKFTKALFGSKSGPLNIDPASGIPIPEVKKPSLFSKIANVALPAVYGMANGVGLVPGLMGGMAANTAADIGGEQAAANDYMKRLYQKSSMDTAKQTAIDNSNYKTKQQEIEAGQNKTNNDLKAKDLGLDWIKSKNGMNYSRLKTKAATEGLDLAEKQTLDILRQEAKTYGL